MTIWSMTVSRRQMFTKENFLDMDAMKIGILASDIMIW